MTIRLPAAMLVDAVYAVVIRKRPPREVVEKVFAKLRRKAPEDADGTMQALRDKLSELIEDGDAEAIERCKVCGLIREGPLPPRSPRGR